MIAGVGICRSSRGAARKLVAPARGWPGHRASAGFTLIELVMVLVLTGVLAVFLAPRLSGIGDFNARGFHDETLAMLRYAQKTAIAQRRLVCVGFSANTATLTQDADQNPATGANGCEANLTGPRGESPGLITGRGSAQYASTPAVVVFDGLGQPDAGRSIQVQGHSVAVLVESVTGHVHE